MLKAAPPLDSQVRLFGHVPGINKGMVCKSRNLGWSMALLYEQHVEQLRVVGETLCGIAEENTAAIRTRHFNDEHWFTEPESKIPKQLRITSEQVRVPAHVIRTLIDITRLEFPEGEKHDGVLGVTPAYTLPVSPAAMPTVPEENITKVQVSIADAPVLQSQDEDSGLPKRERQIRAIEAEVKKAGYDKLKIKTGCKAQLRKACKTALPQLFGAGDDPFNDAWSVAISCKPPRLQMADHKKFARK